MSKTMPKNTREKRGRTLKAKLLQFVGGLLLVLLLGNFFVNISVMRDYLQNQLQSHAQDAATSLGLSLSSGTNARDKITASRLIDSIFDSGDYLKVTYLDIQENVIVDRQQTAEIDGVPSWFIEKVRLDVPSGKAQVMSGWTQLGTLIVQSHPGYSYIELWRVARTQVLWFCLVVVFGFILAQIFISAILRPLKRVEQQAHEMSNNRFDYRAPVPKTRELASVAGAMNDMADKLGKVFSEQLSLIESLRKQSFLDALTGLSNREGFDQRLKADLESKQNISLGTLLLIQISGFDVVNQQHGRKAGDEILLAVSDLLIELIRQHMGSYGARRSGADFTVYLPGMTGEIADDATGQLMSKLSSLSQIKQLLRDDIMHIGVACAIEDDNTGTLLSKADMALRQAQSKGLSGWQRYAMVEADKTGSYSESALEEVRQAGEWLTILQNVLLNRAVQLHVQPVFDMKREQYLYQQVLARIELEDGLVVAGMFLPMVKRFLLTVPFDQMVVEKAIQSLAQSDDLSRYCITLSESSLLDEHFLVWLEEQLAGEPAIAKRLIFEVSEYVINYSEDALLKLCGVSRKYGARVSIEGFGASSVPFAYLQRVDIDVIKVDHSFVRDIDENQDSQFFIRSAIQIAHSQDIHIVAVGVETEAEWEALCALGVDGAQGYYLGRPEDGEIL